MVKWAISFRVVHFEPPIKNPPSLFGGGGRSSRLKKRGPRTPPGPQTPFGCPFGFLSLKPRGPLPPGAP